VIGLPFINKILILSNSVESDFKKAMLYYAFWILIKSFFWFYSSGLIASQDISSFNKINTINIIIKLIGSYLLVKLGYGLFGLISATIISEIFSGFMFYFRHEKLYPSMKLKWILQDKPLLSEMFMFGLNFFIINLSTRFVLYSDNLIVGNLYGAIASSVFYSTLMPSTLLNNIVMRITDSATPAINELYSKNQIFPLKAAYFKLHRITLFMIGGFSIGYIFFAKSIITLWVGINQYGGIQTVVFASLFGFVLTMVHVDNAVIIARGKVKNLTMFALFEGTLKIVLSFILGRNLGISGIIMATFIANIPTSSYIFITSQRIIHSNIFEYYHEVVAKSFMPVTILIGTCILYYSTGVHSVLISLFCFIIISIIYVLTIWLFSIKKDEKELIIKYLVSTKFYLKTV
jgi:O-antigen/teichoic acid export membrane protein